MIGETDISLVGYEILRLLGPQETRNALHLQGVQQRRAKSSLRGNPCKESIRAVQVELMNEYGPHDQRVPQRQEIPA